MRNKKFRNQLKNEIIKIDKVDFNDEVLRRMRTQEKQKISFEKEILLFFSIAAILIFTTDLKIINTGQISTFWTISLICLIPIVFIFYKIIYNSAIKKS